MKTLIMIVLLLLVATGGFFAGKYHEANRELTAEDLPHMKQRLANSAGKWVDNVAKGAKGLLGAE